jgi:ribosome biogenesis GTPase
VGKSSLIQHFVPNATVRVGEISDWSEKGQHTTTNAEEFESNKDGNIIDKFQFVKLLALSCCLIEKSV